MSSRLAAMAAAAASVVQTAVATVDCGGHLGESCDKCPMGNGHLWCNGDCAWVATSVFGGNSGECLPKVGVAVPGESPAAAAALYYELAFLLVSGIIMLIFACFYNQMVIKSPPGLGKVNMISSVPWKGLFECVEYPDTCLYSLFCTPVVAAKNYYAADVCPFWPGCLLTFATGWWSPLFPVGIVVRGVLSGRVQDRLGVEHECLMDFLYAALCFPCDVGRESLEVDQEIGADIRCCCKVTFVPRIVADTVNIVEKADRAVERTCDKYTCFPTAGR